MAPRLHHHFDRDGTPRAISLADDRVPQSAYMSWPRHTDTGMRYIERYLAELPAVSQYAGSRAAAQRISLLR